MLTCYTLLAFVLPLVVLPISATGSPISTAGDLIFVVPLLGLATVMLALAALDSGASFGAMGSQRGMSVHALMEPVFIVAFGALAVRWHTTNLAEVSLLHHDLGINLLVAHPMNLLIVAGLLTVMLAETGRMPFDDPTTHLELTMYERAAHVEYGGIDFAFLQWAESLRLLVFGLLVMNLIWSPPVIGQDDALAGLLGGGISLLTKAIVGGVILAVIEQSFVKFAQRDLWRVASGALLLVTIAVLINTFS
jgi:formate hydrogenlyase subunit 4